MIIDCVSDMHGSFPELEGGDLLILAGDHTSNDTIPAWKAFYDWFRAQKYRKKIMIAGNHDNHLQYHISDEMYDKEFKQFFDDEERFYDYLCDSGTEFEGLKLWGSPWTRWFSGVNPSCKAFMIYSNQDLKKKWSLIPDDTDILITHSPPEGILDRHNSYMRPLGCGWLKEKVAQVQPLLHVFGHIHEGYGRHEWSWEPGKTTQFVNAAHMTREYEPTNKPIRIEL
jgi:Icc-related predicted phosphoesterase